MLTRFHEQLAAYLRRANLSGTAFADRVGVSQSTMSRIQSGGRPPDIAWLDGWAEALALSGTERADFVLAGQLANCPLEVAELLERADAEKRALLERLTQAEAINARLERMLTGALPRPQTEPPAG